MTKATLIKAHNGYFQIWRRPCGCEVRFNTESFGSMLRRAGSEEARRFNAATAEHLGAARCSRCQPDEQDAAAIIGEILQDLGFWSGVRAARAADRLALA